MSNSIVGAKKKERKPRIAVDSAASISTAKLLYGIAEGEVYGLADGAKSIRLDGTPLVDDNGNGNFSGVRWTFAAGTNDQEHISGFPDVSNEVGVGVELKSSQPWIKAFNDTQLSAVRVRFKWDRLSKTNPDNGDVNGYTIKYAIDLQTDGGAYHEIINTKIQEKTSAGYERTHRIDLPKAKTGWQLRVRRITPNDTSEYVQDTMMIDAVAEVIDVKLSYPNTALLGIEYNAEIFSSVAKMSVRVKGKIIRVPDNYDPVARTYTGIWTGNFKDAYSNNPAWIFYDLCTQWRGGLGERLDATMIDRWSLYALGQYCDQMVSDGQGGLEPRFTCNVYLQKQADAYQVLQNIGGIFRAMSYWNGEKIILDADVPQDPVYTFSRANVVDGHFEYTGTRARDRHTLAKVAWSNPLNKFETEYEYIRDEKAMAKFGVKVLDLSAFGCTSQAQAQRAGLWALKTEQLETRQVAFSVGLDGVNCTVGNIINVSDELFAGRANGGRVSTVNETQTVIELDREVTASVGDVLIINGGSGKSERRNISNVVGNRITVTASFTSAEPEHVWAIETADLKLMRFRVMQITENDDNTYNIVAIQHEPQKYDAIDFGTDVKPTDITIVNPETIDAPESVTITSRHREVQGQTVATLVIGWAQVSGAVAYDVEWRKDDGTWIKVPRTGNTSAEIDGVYSGQYLARVRAVSAFDVQSQPTASMLTEVKGKIGLPPTVVGLTATGILFGMDLKWGFASGSGDAAYTEIQVGSAPDVNVATLGQYSYPTNTHTINGLQGNLNQSYRARLVDKLGFKSPWSAWVTGTTDANADKIMDLIQGQINEGSLNDILTSKIADIEVNKDAISQETQDRIQAIIDANSRIDGVISNADVEYYLSTDATTPTGGEWQTTAPEWQQGKFMFSRTKLTGADGTVKYNPNVNGVNITGAKGDKGDKGEQGADGIRGLNGIDGKDGTNGLNGLNGNFTHIAYSTSSTGIPFSPTWFADATYIGIYVDKIEVSSATASKYNWSLIKGANGANGVAGQKGADGRTPYFHVAYATSADGSQGFSTIVSAGKTYIGQYTDYKLEDEENDKSLYSWTKIKGEVGDKGDIGRGIESFVEQYGVSRSKTVEPTTWTATAPVVTKGDYVWTRSEITYKDPHKVEHTDPIVSPAWAAISEFNTEFINFQEDTGNEFIAQGEKMEGIISDYKPRYTDKTRYTDASRSQQWTYWKTVAADNYASNQRITNLQSEFADSNANFTNELFTLAQADKAISSSVSQLSAKTDSNTALIQEVSLAITTPSTGLAAKLSELETEIKTPDKLAALVEGSGVFSDDFGSISGKFTNFEAVIDGQKTAMEVISGIGNAEKLKNEIAKARLDKNVTNLNAQSVALTTQIDGYTTKIADVTAKRNATSDMALKAEYNNLITDLTAAKDDLTAQKAVIADQAVQLVAEKKVLDDFKEVEDGVRAQHTVKIDNAGKIVGFGLVLQKDGFSAFDVRADRFSISAPSDKPDDVTGTSPFMVLTNPQVIDGVTVPAGLYTRNFYAPRASIDTIQIKDAAIKTAHIGDAQVDTLQIKGGAVTIPRLIYKPNGKVIAENGVLFGATLSTGTHLFRFNNTIVNVDKITESIGSASFDAMGGSVSIQLSVEDIFLYAQPKNSTDYRVYAPIDIILLVRRGNTVLRERVVVTVNDLMIPSSGKTYKLDSLSLPALLDVPPSGVVEYTAEIILVSYNENANKNWTLLTNNFKFSVGVMSLQVTGTKR